MEKIFIRRKLTRNPGLVGEGADSHGGNGSGQVQGHFVFILSSENIISINIVSGTVHHIHTFMVPFSFFVLKIQKAR